ncbi:MAG: phytoene desaturase family protein [Segniliparus sp.]|uniref:phytoene desaturase family protein n=1 Tax=Segniliparus sp. TaxID=2804064 RepID=UPI003F36B690
MPETRSRDWDAIVIGSGLSGISAAAHLAACGKSVLVLEQYQVIGGSSHVFRRERKWGWDVGVHHMGDCGPGGILPALFQSLGADGRVEFLELDPKAFETYQLPDVSFAPPRGWQEYENRLIETFPDETAAIKKFVPLLRKAGSFDRDRGPSSLLRSTLGVLKTGSAARWLASSSQAVFDHFGFSKNLQIVLSSPFGSIDCPPSRLPFGIYAIFQRMFIHGGSWYPKGGGQTLSAHLADVVRSYGGEIRVNAFVDKIVIESGRAAGVRLRDGTHYSAPVVVSGADIKKTMLQMVGEEHISRRYARRIAKYKMATPFFNAYIGLNTNLADTMTAQDIFVYPTVIGFDELERRFDPKGKPRAEWLDLLRREAPVYIHSSNVKDRAGTRYAPAGHSAVEIMLPLPMDYASWGIAEEDFRGAGYRRSSDYRQLKDEILDILIERADSAIPNFADSVVYKELSTPVTQERYTRTTEGSAYGIEFNRKQAGPLRPGVRTPVKGLFLCGSSTSWGPGTEAALVSGRWAASAIVGRDLQKEASSGARLVDPRVLTPLEDGWDPLELSQRVAVQHGRSETRRAALDALVD